MFLHFPVSSANTMHALQKDIRPQISRKIHSTYTTYSCEVKRYRAKNKPGLISEGGISEG